MFMQGCVLRCQYCHNPDTWNAGGRGSVGCGSETTVPELTERILRLKTYFGKRGGLTVSGGEPLLQAEFVAGLFAGVKACGVHTALDTSGAVQGDFGELLGVTDLVILDVKHTAPEAYRALTSGELQNTLDFLGTCRALNKNVLIRQVIIPGVNDTAEQVTALKKIAAGIPIELKPYHRLGLQKWEALGKTSPLQNTPLPAPEHMEELRKIAGALTDQT